MTAALNASLVILGAFALLVVLPLGVFHYRTSAWLVRDPSRWPGEVRGASRDTLNQRVLALEKQLLPLVVEERKLSEVYGSTWAFLHGSEQVRRAWAELEKAETQREAVEQQLRVVRRARGAMEGLWSGDMNRQVRALYRSGATIAFVRQRTTRS